MSTKSIPMRVLLWPTLWMAISMWALISVVVAVWLHNPLALVISWITSFIAALKANSAANAELAKLDGERHE